MAQEAPEPSKEGLILKTVPVPYPGLDSIGQALPNRSSEYLKSSIRDLPSLIYRQEMYIAEWRATINLYQKDLANLEADLVKMGKNNLHRLATVAKINDIQNLLSRENGILEERRSHLEKVLHHLQMDLQLYCCEALERGILSASEVKQSLERAGLGAAVALQPSSSCPKDSCPIEMDPTLSVPQPSQPQIDWEQKEFQDHFSFELDI